MMEQKTEQIENLAALAIITLMAVGSFFIVRPFLPAALWAIIFAVSSWPLFTWIEGRLGGRSGAAAGVLTVLFMLVFIIPVAFVGVKLADQSSLVTEFIHRTLRDGLPTLPDWVGRIPLAGSYLTEKWAALSAHTPNLADTAGPYLKSIGALLLTAGAGIGMTIGMLLLSMMILFFFLKEGRSIAASLDRMVTRIGGAKGLRLLHLAGATMSSVVYGILGAAFAQGILATFGLWLAGVPGWLFLGIAVGGLALIPLGLTALILFPAAGWLFYTGQTGWGIFMLIWAIVVGNIDSYIRPVVISKGADLPFIVVFLGILGGIATGGILGLFIGATVLGLFYTLLMEWSVGDKVSVATTTVPPEPAAK
jgi:predicted PurR-regulated permease PerM